MPTHDMLAKRFAVALKLGRTVWIRRCVCQALFCSFSAHPQRFCSPACRNRHKPSRHRNKAYLQAFRKRHDLDDLATLAHAATTHNTRDRRHLSSLTGIGPRRILWLARHYPDSF